MKNWQKFCCVSLGAMVVSSNCLAAYVYIPDDQLPTDDEQTIILKPSNIHSANNPTPPQVEIEIESTNNDSGWFNWREMAPVLGLKLGLDQTEVGQSQSIKLTSADRNASDFKATEQWNSQMVWGAFAGIEIPFDKSGKNRWQTGFAYYQTNAFNTEGIIEFLGDPSNVDLGYSYAIKNQRFMFENKFLRSLNDRFSFYLLGSIGSAKNAAENGKTHLLDTDNGNTLSNFASNTVNSFSYAVGLGLEMEVIDYVRVGVGYQFSDLGKAELGEFQSFSPSGDKIENSHLYTNEFLLGLSFVFN